MDASVSSATTMNALFVRADALLAEQIVDSVYDAETAKDATSSMDKLKKMLDLAEQYGRYAREFCTSEARLYVRIASISDCESSLSSSKRELVNWIRSKGDEIDAILEEVATGVRINTIRNRELRELRKEISKRTPLVEFSRISSEILTEYRETGKATVSQNEFATRWQLPEAIDTNAAKAYTEKTRDSILNSGGVGIADGIGTYVNPKSANRNVISRAVEARLNSIYADLCSLASLCKQAKFSIQHEGVRLLREKLDEIEVG